LPAGKLDLVIEPGADFWEIYEYALTDVDGTAVDFSTGWTAAAQMRRDYDSTEILLTFTISLAIAGKITLTATAANTELVTRSGVWDLELTKTSSGRKIRLLRGRAVLSEEVTR
jgi:hypothetical protein